MKRIKELLSGGARDLWLMQKRVFVKPVFAVVLLLIILLSIVYPLLNSERGGMIKVAVWADKKDLAAQTVVDDLVENRGLIVCTRYEDGEEAKEAVRTGEVDAAWIFLPDLAARINAFLDDSEPIVDCYEKEGSVYLTLSRERLFTALYESVSRVIFSRELKKISGAEPSAELVQKYYGDGLKKGELIEFRDEENRVIVNQDYMVSPLKGLLAILVFVGGMAAAILCAREEKSGVYMVLGRKRAVYFKLIEILLPMIDLAVAVYIALACLGLLISPLYDALLLFVYVLACASLCFFIMEALRTPVRMSISLLVIVLLSIAASPVFIYVRGLRAISVCLPCYHYLVGVYSRDHMRYLLLYAAVCLIPALVIDRLYKRR